MQLKRLVVVEVLAPQRPPASPTEYFQLNIGGYDPETLLRVNDDFPLLPGRQFLDHEPKPTKINLNFLGYVGCFRGFQIHDTLIDLPPKINSTIKGS